MEVGVEGEVDCSIPTVLALVGEEEVGVGLTLVVGVGAPTAEAVVVEEVVAPKVAAEVGGLADVVVVKEIVAPKVAAEVGFAEVVVVEEVAAPKVAAEVGSCRKGGGVAGGVGRLVCVACVACVEKVL